MSAAPPPPTPQHILRSHSSPISALFVSEDNDRIYSGDASGKVVVTSTGSLRAISQWNAHTDSILGVEEWDDHILTYVCDFLLPYFASFARLINACRHARDNKLHVWQRIKDTPFSARLGGSAALPSLPVPPLLYSIDVNTLNFCRFSLLKLAIESVRESKALIALPNLVDSSTVCNFHSSKLSEVLIFVS